jgi:hypothetical protein
MFELLESMGYHPRLLGIIKTTVLKNNVKTSLSTLHSRLSSFTHGDCHAQADLPTRVRLHLQVGVATTIMIRLRDSDHLPASILQHNHITRDMLSGIHVRDGRLVKWVSPSSVTRTNNQRPLISRAEIRDQRRTYLIPIFSIQLLPSTQSKFVSSLSMTGCMAVLLPTVIGKGPRLTSPA